MIGEINNVISAKKNLKANITKLDNENTKSKSTNLNNNFGKMPYRRTISETAKKEYP